MKSIKKNYIYIYYILYFIFLINLVLLQLLLINCIYILNKYIYVYISYKHNLYSLYIKNNYFV